MGKLLYSFVLRISGLQLRRRLLALLILVGFVIQLAVDNASAYAVSHFADSSNEASQKNDSTKPSVRSTVKLNSLGYFSYGGRIVSDKQSLDVSLIYERRNWGVFLFKVVDLFDHQSANNFAMAMVFTHLVVNDRITITPYVGFVMEQLESFADKGSDLGTIVVSKIKLTDRVSAEHAAVISNLMLEPHHKDWVNRIRLIFDSGHYNLTWLGWHNNNVLDSSGYYSTGFSAAYNKIVLTEHLHMNAGVTAYKMIQSTREDANPIDNGLLLSISLVIN